MTRIKICGLTRDDDVSLCEELGVDYAGFIFAESSPRKIEPKDAKRLRSLINRSEPVGVFMAEQAKDIPAIADAVGLTHVQIYGDVPSDIDLSELTLIRSFRAVPTLAEITRATQRDLILLDGPRNGMTADHQSITTLPDAIRSRLFIAGGLTPKNVGAVVRLIKSFGVDAASGVESAPGIKDPKLLRAFVGAVRAADASFSDSPPR